MPVSKGYMGFVGVSTAESSIMKVFPLWAKVLGLPTEKLVGHDLPLDSDTARYADLVEAIKHDPHHLGALVTSHKMNLYRAAFSVFDELDPFASACQEISSISKREGRLIGRAKDPFTVALALEDFLVPGHFEKRDAEVLILGAGGSGTALSWALADRATDQPSRVTVAARTQSKLDELRRVHERRGTREGFVRYELTGSQAKSDALLEGLPEGSLVVNATGLGKDSPGSPVSDSAAFPRHGIAWEFNYRGSLEFLHQAQQQQAERDLLVVDGWRYFIHGWSQVVADVFDLDLTPTIVEELAASAEGVRAKG
jgi:shikimate dehydrogenase